MAATRLVMAATRKPWGTGEFAHDIAAVAPSWLRTHTPGSSEPLAVALHRWFCNSFIFFLLLDLKVYHIFHSLVV